MMPLKIYIFSISVLIETPFINSESFIINLIPISPKTFNRFFIKKNLKQNLNIQIYFIYLLLCRICYIRKLFYVYLSLQL